MKHRRSLLPYLLILIGIILPIFLMQHLMQTTAHKGGVAKKDIPSNAVTSTASAQGMNGPVEVEVIATPEKIYSVKVLRRSLRIRAMRLTQSPAQPSRAMPFTMR